MLSTRNGRRLLGFAIGLIGGFTLLLASAGDEIAGAQGGFGDNSISITAAPADDLVTGDRVVVTGSGVPAWSGVIGFQCRRTATADRGCDNGIVVAGGANEQGEFRLEFSARRQIQTDDGPFDCATDGCMFAVVSLANGGDDSNRSGTANVTFDPSAPIPTPPSIKVKPARNLVDGDRVTVTGTGFVFNPNAWIQQCAAVRANSHDDCDFGANYYSDLGPNGEFFGMVNVQRMVSVGGQRVDCGARAGACTLRVNHGDETVEAPLHFDPSVKPPKPPKVTLSPRGGFVDRSEVTVTLDNLENGSRNYYFNFLQCPGAPTEQWAPGCRRLAQGLFESGAEVVTLTRALNLDGEVFDCAAAANACSISVFSNGGLVSSTGLRFARTNEPIPKPSVKYSKNLKRLTDGAKVWAKVQGSVDDVTVFQCPGEVRTGRGAGCRAVGGWYGFENGDAVSLLPAEGVKITGRVLRMLSRTNWDSGQPVQEMIDCAAKPGACNIVTWVPGVGQVGPARALTLVDEGAPAKPKLKLNKAKNLSHGDIVRMSFTGMTPGTSIAINQCPRGTTCGITGSFEEISKAKFSIEYSVARVIDVAGTRVDCGEKAKNCELQAVVTNGAELVLRKAISFDPNFEPPSPPALNIEPNTGLSNRQEVELRVNDFVGGFNAKQCALGISSSQANTYLYTDGCTVLGGAWTTDGTDSMAKVSLPRYVYRDGKRVDCAKGRGCNVFVFDQFEGRWSDSARVKFASSEPAPPKTSFTLSKTRKLVDGEDIQIAVGGDFGGVTVSQCVYENPVDGNGCRFMATSDESTLDGPIELTAAVSRDVRGRDCTKVSCWVVLRGKDQRVAASIRVRIDKSARRVKAPTISVAPSSGLVDRNPITIEIDGFVTSYDVMQCVEAADDELVDCQRITLSRPDSRTSTTTLAGQVRREVGDTDCAKATCVLQVRYATVDLAQSSKEQRLALSFDANAQPFPAPELAATPTTDLTNGDRITLSGKHWAPGSWLSFGVCKADVPTLPGEPGNGGSDWASECGEFPLATVLVDDTGAFTFDFVAAQSFRSFIGIQRFCTDDCVIYTTTGRDSARVPISFGKSAGATVTMTNTLEWPESVTNPEPSE